MSLNWNLSAIANHETLCWVETGKTMPDGKPHTTMNPITNALIWATMIVDLGEITWKNYGDFHMRLQLHSKLFGPFMNDGSDLTLEQVKDHIGLKTNVSNKTYAQFSARMAKNFEQEQRRNRSKGA